MGANIRSAPCFFGGFLKKSLQTSEWVLVSSLILLLVSLVTISRLHEHRIQSQLEDTVLRLEQTFSVTIKGEVANPGTFTAKEGRRLGDIVKKSRPKRFADIRALNLDSPIESSMEIEIALLKEIIVHIEGAVELPINLTLPAGARISDLKSKIHLREDADFKFLQRRRLLKDGETIVIPKKRDKALDQKSVDDL